MEPTTFPELRKRWPELSAQQVLWRALNNGLVVVHAKRGKKTDEAAAASRLIARRKLLADRSAARRKTQSDKATQMAKLRPEQTYKQIGEQFGVTNERVRQLLKEHGYDNLLGHVKERIKKICPECGNDFGANMGIIVAEQRKFCNASCFSAYVSTHMTDREREVVTGALKLRAEGKTWRNAAISLGLTGNGPGTGLSTYIKKMAAKEGMDVTAAFGFQGKRKNAKRVAA